MTDCRRRDVTDWALSATTTPGRPSLIKYAAATYTPCLREWVSCCLSPLFHCKSVEQPPQGSNVLHRKPSVTLPPETLDKILERMSTYYEGLRTLITCALVATWWTGPSQRCLFSSVEIDNENYQRWTDGVIHSGPKSLCCLECTKINHRKNGTLCANFPQVPRRLLPPSTVVQTFVERRPESPTFISGIRLLSGFINDCRLSWETFNICLQTFDGCLRTLDGCSQMFDGCLRTSNNRSKTSDNRS